jgi:hypothetical protein
MALGEKMMEQQSRHEIYVPEIGQTFYFPTLGIVELERLVELSKTWGVAEAGIRLVVENAEDFSGNKIFSRENELKKIDWRVLIRIANQAAKEIFPKAVKLAVEGFPSA